MEPLGLATACQAARIKATTSQTGRKDLVGEVAAFNIYQYEFIINDFP